MISFTGLHVVDFWPIRESLKLTETCRYLRSVINDSAVWRHRLMGDFMCYSFSTMWCNEKSACL